LSLKFLIPLPECENWFPENIVQGAKYCGRNVPVNAIVAAAHIWSVILTRRSIIWSCCGAGVFLHFTQMDPLENKPGAKNFKLMQMSFIYTYA
jgi:hypothetical protein